MKYPIIYIVASVFVVSVNVIFAILAFRRKNKTASFLGEMTIVSSLIAISYLSSLMSKREITFSIFSSIYFSMITLILITLNMFIFSFVGLQKTKHAKIVFWILSIYYIIEGIFLLINPFYNIVITYEPSPYDFTYFIYGTMKPIYIIHLIVTYSLVVTALVTLLWKSFTVPREYRNQYLFIVYTILAIVGFNAIFLFFKTDKFWTNVDYSLIFYCAAINISYYSAFIYTKKAMLDRFKSAIFENIDQGLLLFDFSDNIILYNKRSTQLIKNFDLNDKTTLREFLDGCNISLDKTILDDSYSLQVNFSNEDGSIKPLRCDYRQLSNKQGKLLGRLFVFADIALETDLLTGYQNWDSFKKYATDNPDAVGYPSAIGVCDVNGLATYNSAYGHNAGDALLKKMADNLKQALPKNSYFIRGRDSALIVLCYQKTEDYMLEKLKETLDPIGVSIEYATAYATEENHNVLESIDTAFKSLSAKKLLNKDSRLSAILTSLVKALHECDSDTEAHVGRTRKLGLELGKRIGLTDVEQSELSLLCLLHDIGKIGVPLEILNKPGKLTESEWEIIKSHVQKGYEIAKSTPELSSLAPKIKYHHERWDGNGYPEGLSKESIPLLSRIISVVDAFDAMVNNRSYRKALGLDEAKSEIVRCAGSQFDPYLAREFLNLLEETDINPIADVQATTVEKTELDVKDDETNNKYCNVFKIDYIKYILDSDMHIISYDDKLLSFTGYSKEDFEDPNFTQTTLLPEEDRSQYTILAREQITKNQMAYFEHRILCKNGDIKNVFCYGKTFFDSSVKQYRSEVIIVDNKTTHSVKLLRAELDNKAKERLRRWEDTYRRDPLTGLLTHAAFQNDIEQRLLKNETILFMMIDLDYFKQYNDTFGHHAGDEFLVRVAQSINAHALGNALTCRMGGDEFAVAFIEPKNPADTAKKFYADLSASITEITDKVTATVGATISIPSDSFNSVYEKADKLLYEAKEQGRNRLLI